MATLSEEKLEEVRVSVETVMEKNRNIEKEMLHMKEEITKLKESDSEMKNQLDGNRLELLNLQQRLVSIPSAQENELGKLLQNASHLDIVLKKFNALVEKGIAKMDPNGEGMTGNRLNTGNEVQDTTRKEKSAAMREAIVKIKEVLGNGNEETQVPQTQNQLQSPLFQKMRTKCNFAVLSRVTPHFTPGNPVVVTSYSLENIGKFDFFTNTPHDQYASSDLFDLNTGVYTIPARGRYKFSMSLAGDEDAMLEWFFVDSNGTQRYLFETGGYFSCIDTEVNDVFEEGDKVWIQVVKVREGEAALVCKFRGEFLEPM